jgi:predicted acylesterase/phospholipase RssA
MALLRSYDYENAVKVEYDKCKIWQACRATSAATTFFDPILIGPTGRRFIDGGILENNPINQVLKEARGVWPNREFVLISIGTGSAPSGSFGGTLLEIIHRMKDIVTETERTNQTFLAANRPMVESRQVFRFNVLHGLEDVGLQEHREIGRIEDATET